MADHILQSPNDQYRLPTAVKPTHYEIAIKTDLEALTFQGYAKIKLDIKQDTSSIVFNSSGLDLGVAVIQTSIHGPSQHIASSSFDKDQERTTYTLHETLKAGSKADLTIYYSAELTNSMLGYYRSAWGEESKKKHYALTQFEPTAARRAFPCWDEPLLKATFAITMISREGTLNLSNMPAVSEEVLSESVDIAEELKSLVASTKNEAWKITKFATTPPMSTYIVAFANGPFKYLEDSVKMPVSGKTIPLRIYATEDVIHQCQFALDTKKAVLPLYEKIFDVEYPLPKLDTLVASDFDLGAMENWGLITGRTSFFLLDPKRTDWKAKKWVMTGQSHEVSHMWFGNITTMEWWKYLYLNEGFATLMGEVIIPDRVYPEWKVNSEFINEHLNRALDLDSRPSSHPIEVECPDANHINQIFDSLSYSKAGSVLRMLSAYVGEEKFLKGVSIYLKKHLYGNSVTHDLWNGISEVTGLDITDLMENWICKIGFPLLTVTESSTSITVRQDRFLATGPPTPEENETIWNVPLGIISTGSDGKVSVDLTPVLRKREQTFPIDTSKPYKLNAGTNGVYRVLYTPERLAAIAEEAIKENSPFSIEDRIGLVQDAMALAQAGFGKLSSALTLVDLWKNEKEYLVWSGINEPLYKLVSIWWEYPDIIQKLNLFRKALFEPLVDRLGYKPNPGEDAGTAQLRTLAISQAASAGSDKVIKVLQGLFQAYVDTGDISNIPADLVQVTFSTVVRHGSQKEYDAVTGIFNAPKTPSEHIAAMVAFGSSQQPELWDKTLSLVEKARDQDIVYFFYGLAANHKARRRLTKYFFDNYDVLFKRLERNFALQGLVRASTQFYSSQADYNHIQDFFKDKDTSKYNQTLEQSLDAVKARTGLVGRSTEDLSSWLKERY